MTLHLINQVRKLNRYYKQKGFFWLCRHILANLYHHQPRAVFEGDISKNHEVIQAKIPVNIRLLTVSEEDIDKLTEFWPEMFTPLLYTREQIRELITKRLSAGDICLIAEYNESIVHMNWIGFYNTHIFDMYELKRGLFPGEALSYYTYCSEDYRGNRLMGAVHTEALNLLESRGFRKYIGYVDQSNQASIKVSTQFCGKPTGTVHTFKIFGLYFYCLRKQRA